MLGAGRDRSPCPDPNSALAVQQARQKAPPPQVCQGGLGLLPRPPLNLGLGLRIPGLLLGLLLGAIGTGEGIVQVLDA